MEIFDRSLIRTHLQRALPSIDAHDFLWRHCAKELQERLLDIKRDFSNAVEISVQPYVLTPEFLTRKNISTVLHASALTGQGQVILDEEFLPFKHGSLDAIVSTCHLHWVNDVPGTLVQWRQALKPDGVLIGALFGGDTLQELRACIAQAETEVYGGISPRVSPFIGLQDMAALMQRTNYALPVVDHDVVTISYESFTKLIADLRGMGQTQAIHKRSKKPVSRKFWRRVEEIYAQQFSNAVGKLQVTVELIYFLGWAPAASQPQPLKRGSATHSLVQILGS
jgi:NADH dehydrogenase [ubiquinone] 1 alpha subcomplex assembly factor 5